MTIYQFQQRTSWALMRFLSECMRPASIIVSSTSPVLLYVTNTPNVISVAN